MGVYPGVRVPLKIYLKKRERLQAQNTASFSTPLVIDPTSADGFVDYGAVYDRSNYSKVPRVSRDRYVPPMTRRATLYGEEGLF